MSEASSAFRQVVISVDYEIFGNGTGDVRQHVVDPTARMARMCEKHGVPLTVFFEVEEYLAFVKYADELQRSLGCDPARLIRKQLTDLVRRGHDVQLHLHPQWFGARFENGGWRLRPEMETVDGLFESQEEVTRYIGERKAVIETMTGGRKVRAYRAGAFNAQPGQKLLGALAANGIVIDSSVVKGLHRRNQHVCFDYRNAPVGKTMWRVRNDVATEDRSGAVWEIPIHAVPGRRFHQITWRRLKAKFSKNVPQGRQNEMLADLGVKANPVKFLWQPVPLKLDYHNVSPGRLRKWIQAAPPSNSEIDVMVTIGHTKEHTDDRGFEAFLSLVAGDANLRVVGFDEVAGQLDRGQGSVAGKPI